MGCQVGGLIVGGLIGRTNRLKWSWFFQR